MKRYVSIALLITVFAAAATCYSAPTRPDSGEVNSTLRDHRLPPVTRPAPGAEVVPAPAPEASRDQTKVRITQIQISGEIPFNAASLQGILGKYVNQDLSLVDLTAATDALTVFLRKEGYPVATAILPAQEVKGGVVKLLVVMGKYGQFDVKNTSRLANGQVEGIISALKKEKFVEAKSLDRTLLALNDLAGVTVKATLKPGSNPGTSDLVVEVTDAKRESGSVAIDNYGSRFLGQTRTSYNFGLQNPFGMGDSLALGGIIAGSGLNDYRASYQTPIGSSGFRIGAGYTQTYYLLGDEYASLGAYGRVNAFNVFASYPLVRSRNYNLYARVGFDSKHLSDYQDSTSTDVFRQVSLVSAGVYGDRLDKSGGGGTSFSLTVSGGNLNIDDADTQAIDDAYSKTAGSFNKANLALSRIKQISPRLQYYLSLQAQAASKNLNSSEKMSLGGAYGVRAYPQGEASGDEGLLFTGELRYLANANLQLIAFLDAGSVTLNKNPWDSAVNHRSLLGAGIGVAWSRARDYSIRLDYAWKLGSEMAVSDTDKNGRFWFTGTKYF